MSRVRFALAALAVAAGLLAAPAEAAPYELVRLEGSRSGWVEVTIPGRWTYPIYDVEIRTRGRFAGYYAEQLTSTAGEQYAGAQAGTLSLRDLSVPGKRRSQVLLGVPRLTSGTVRFYLVADGPTTVRITTDSPPDEVLPVVRPRRFVTPRVVSGSLRPDGDRWAGTLGVTLPRGALIVAGMLAYGDLLDAAEAHVCVAEHCDQRDPVGDRVRGIGQPGDPDSMVRADDPSRLWWLAYRPGGLSAGRRVARFSLAGPLGGVRGGVVAVFSLPLA